MTDLEELMAAWDPERFVAWLEDDNGDNGNGVGEDGERGEKRPTTVRSRREVMPQHANPNGQLRGGRLMDWMDQTAAMAAKKYAETAVTTASSDRIVFDEPIKVGDPVLLESRIDYVGTTSMMIHVDVYVEDYRDQGQRHTTDAYFTFVALDDDYTPTPVPELYMETDEERDRYREAEYVKDCLES